MSYPRCFLTNYENGDRQCQLKKQLENLCSCLMK